MLPKCITLVIMLAIAGAGAPLNAMSVSGAETGASQGAVSGGDISAQFSWDVAAEPRGTAYPLTAIDEANFRPADPREDLALSAAALTVQSLSDASVLAPDEKPRSERVPEAATLVFFATGLIAIAGDVRKRKVRARFAYACPAGQPPPLERRF